MTTLARRKVKPAYGYELWAWYFMRISGLVLVFLALGHLFITHIINNVENTNYDFVASRWTDPTTGVFWRLWDLAMINLAVFHGCNGLRQVLDEYVPRPGIRKIFRTLVAATMVALMGIGTYAILLFQPDTSYLQRWKALHAPKMVSASVPVVPGAPAAPR
jgi:succinate dehydrogenase / fumarate reductase membrane anchor subunit